MADSDILLTVGLDPRDAIQDAKDLAGEVDKVFKSQGGKELSSKQTALNAQLKKNTQVAEELSRKMGELAEKQIPTDEYKEVAKHLQKMNDEFDKLLIKQDDMQSAGKTSGKAWDALSDKMDQIGTYIHEDEAELQQLVDTGKAFTLGKGTEEYQKMETKLGQMNDQTKVALIKQQEMSDETDKTSKNVGRTAKSLGIFSRLTGAARKGFSGIAHSVKNVERRLKGGFIRLLGMIVGVRGLFSIFMKMRSAVREGFQNLLKADKDLKKQFDDLKDSADELKANLAAAFLPLIQLAIPYVQKLIGWVDQLTSKIAMFVAAITGQNAYTRAIKKTGEAAKNAGKQLSKLDELNVIQQGDDWETSTEKIPLEVTEKAQKLIDTLKSGNWFDLGRGLADSIENFFDSIDWDKIKENARKFAKRLATFLNGFFKPEMFYKAGNFLAQVLNTAIQWALEFGKDLDWENVGYSISEAIRGFFENVDWADFADTIDTWIQGLMDLIKGFLKNKKMWKSVFEGLYEFVSNIDIETVGIIIGAIAIRNSPAMLKKLFASAITEKVGEGVAVKSVGGIVGGLKGTTLASQGTTAVGTVGGASVLGAIGAGVATFAGVYSLVNAFGEIMAMILPGGEFMGLSDEEWAEANPFYKIFGKENVEGFFFQLFDGIKKETDRFYAKGGVWDKVWTGVTDGFKKYLDGMKIMWGDFFDKLKEKVDKFGEFWYGSNGVWAKVFAYWSWIGEQIKNVATSIKDWFGARIDDIKGFFANLKGKAQTLFTETIPGFFNNVKQKFADMKANLQTGINSIITFFTNFKTKLSGIADNIRMFFSNLGTFFSTLFTTTIPNIFKRGVNLAIGFINKLIGGVESAVNAIVRALNSLSWSVPSWIPVVGGQSFGFNIPTVSYNRIPALASGAVIPPQMGEFIAKLGDNNKETEVVSPLSTIKQAVVEAMQQLGSLGGEIHIHVDLDGREVAKSVVRQDDIRRMATGVGLFGT